MEAGRAVGVNARQGRAAAHRHESVRGQHPPLARRTGEQAKKPGTVQDSNWGATPVGKTFKRRGANAEACAAPGPRAEAWGARSPAWRKVKLGVQEFPRQPDSWGWPESVHRLPPDPGQQLSAGKGGSRQGTKGLRRAHARGSQVGASLAAHTLPAACPPEGGKPPLGKNYAQSPKFFKYNTHQFNENLPSTRRGKTK